MRNLYLMPCCSYYSSLQSRLPFSPPFPLHVLPPALLLPRHFRAPEMKYGLNYPSNRLPGKSTVNIFSFESELMHLIHSRVLVEPVGIPFQQQANQPSPPPARCSRRQSCPGVIARGVKLNNNIFITTTGDMIRWWWWCWMLMNSSPVLSEWNLYCSLKRIQSRVKFRSSLFALSISISLLDATISSLILIDVHHGP